MSFSGTARSDQLENFSSFLSQSPLLLHLSRLVEAKLIIDANIAIRGLRWMALTRKNPEAQPETIEIAKTGLVTLYAPLFLATEVRKYIPKIAKDAGKSIEEVQTLWNEFATFIQFVDTAPLPEISDGRELRDPKDIPYIQLQEHLQHPILSKDKDIAAMGGRVIDIIVTKRLKQLYRANAVEYQLASFGHVGLCISANAIKSLVTKIQSGFTLLKNAPPCVYLVLAFILFAIFRNPKNRERFADLVEALLENAPEVFTEFGTLIKQATTPYTESRIKAAQIVERLPSELKQKPE